MDNNNIENKTWFTNIQVIYIIAVAISFTFSITMIYSEFIFHKEKIETLDARLDKKTNRNAEAIEFNSKEINELKKNTNE